MSSKGTAHLARQEVGEHDGQASDHGLRNGPGAGFGHQTVAGSHVLVNVLHKALDVHLELLVRLQMRAQGVGHLLVVSADDNQLRAQGSGGETLAQLASDVGHTSDAVPAAHQQHCLPVLLQAEVLAKPAF